MWFKKSMGILVGVGLVLAACTGASQSPGASASAGPSTTPVAQVLRLNMSQEPAHLDPVQASDSISIQVLRSVTRPLAYFDENLAVVPGLADSWDVSADGTQITFHLGTHSYSNGDPIVAGDFVYSWRKLVDPRIAADYAYVMDPIAGFGDAQAADPADNAAVDAALANVGVSAPDDKTFVVKLSRPASYFVYIAALWIGAPEKATFTYAEAADYVSSGPMMMKEWKHGSNIVLVPNPHWNAENPSDPIKIDEIDLAMINDTTASLAAYEADELDVTGVPRAEVARVKADTTLSGQIASGNVLSFSYYGFDLKDPNGPFTKSKLLRKAFNEALDKDVLLNTVFSGIGTVAYSLVPPGMPGHQDTQFIKFDKVQAKKDFDQALTDLGIAAADLHLELGYNVGGSNEDQAVFFQGQWKDVFGIEVKLTATEDFGSYLDRLSNDPYDIFRLGWGADYPHPNNFLTDLISCTSANNNMAYCNPEVDALLASAAAKATLDEQVPIYNQVQEMVMADAPIIPQLFGQRFSLIKPWVQGLTISAQDTNAGELFYYQVSIAAH